MGIERHKKKERDKNGSHLEKKKVLETKSQRERKARYLDETGDTSKE